MEFRCERDVLADALKAATRAASTRSTSLPALACVHLRVAGDVLTVTGTDLETTIAATVDVAGEADGVVLLPAKLAVDVVTRFPAGAVTVKHGGDPSATITAGRSEFQLRTHSTDDYPDTAWLDAEPAVLSAKELVAALNRVTPAASGDDSRPILCGVLFEQSEKGLRIVATDSYRLSYQDLPHAEMTDTGGRALVPADALVSLARLAGTTGDIAVRLGERSVTFTTDGDRLRLGARLIEGEFPNYAGLVPKSRTGRLTVNREQMLDVVKQVSVMARESTPVRFKLGPSDNLLGAQTMDVGSSSAAFDADYDGPEMEVGFNPHYLADALEANPGDTVHIDLVDARNPALVTSPGDESFLSLLMPVRVS